MNTIQKYYQNLEDAEHLKKQVINFFKYEKNNTTPAIAKKFNISISKANSIIDNYLKKL